MSYDIGGPSFGHDNADKHDDAGNDDGNEADRFGHK